MGNISRNLPNICTFSFVRHSKYKKTTTCAIVLRIRRTCAYDGLRSQKSEMRMYTWRNSRWRRKGRRRRTCAYDGLRSQKSEMRMYTWRNSRWAEKADERRKMWKMLLQSPSQYHRMPKIRMRSPNVERNKSDFTHFIIILAKLH